ncbi:MAG: helix-turn-helix domain-containing protein [Phototrophicaceae bacterium]
MSIEKSSNDEREQRILDAAADLIAHYGYDKTTVSDIAREAGISKGAIYLHFDSKDTLFEALLIRETQRYSLRWLQMLEDDKDGGTIGSMYKKILYALNESPFMSAMFKRDARILGSYVRKPDNFFRRQQDQDGRFIFVKMMQDAGVIRKDIDARVISHIMDMLAYGLVTMEDVKNPDHMPETDALLAGIGDILDRALTPPDANPDAGKAIVKQIIESAQTKSNQ